MGINYTINIREDSFEIGPSAMGYTSEDLEYKRANSGIEVEFYESVLGKKLVYSKSKEDILEWREIENAN